MKPPAGRGGPTDLFLRWLWLVYLPLGLAGMGMLLLVGDVVPWWGVPIVLALTGWGAIAARLLLERRRLGLRIPTPPGRIAWVAGAGGFLVVGALLSWIGLARFTTSGGPAFLLLGGFLLLLALMVPAFRVVALALHMAGRMLARRRPRLG
ncbi:MAG: hypothetical protein ACRDIF_07705 [Actinomycetota bacterium]